MIQKKVTIYSKDNCMQCKFTKQWLEDEGLTYTEVRADLDDKALEYVKEELGFNSLPVIVIEGEVPFHGFRLDRLEGLV
mgnify:CR=1 FL=1